MQKGSLHITIRKAVNQFGMNILNEVRLINILLDLGGFDDIPASKVILKEMITDGYCQKICDLGKKAAPLLSFPRRNPWKNRKAKNGNINLLHSQQSSPVKKDLKTNLLTM